MARFVNGEVIVVPFPFTDLTSSVGQVETKTRAYRQG